MLDFDIGRWTLSVGRSDVPPLFHYGVTSERLPRHSSAEAGLGVFRDLKIVR
jgi:hypothetical protein